MTAEQKATEILGDNPVPPAPVTEDGIAKAVLKKIGNFSGLKTEIRKKDTATAKAINGLKTEIRKKDTATAKEVKNSESRIKSNDNGNTGIILIGLAILFLVLLGLGALIYFRTRKIEKKIDDVPKDTAEEIYGFNPLPFNFVIKANGASHRVICSCADEDKETYNTFQVISMPDGPDHPESFVRQSEPRRGLAERYLKGTMMKFFDGKLKGTPQETLIVFLKEKTEKLNYT
jgi:hypothetical protein